LKKNKLLRHLKLFIEPHPIFVDSEEEIYSVKENLKIKLWINSGFKIELEPLVFEINFNIISSGILVIANRKEENVLRILTKNIIAIELVRGNNSAEDLNQLIALKDFQKN